MQILLICVGAIHALMCCAMKDKIQSLHTTNRYLDLVKETARIVIFIPASTLAQSNSSDSCLTALWHSHKHTLTCENNMRPHQFFLVLLERSRWILYCTIGYIDTSNEEKVVALLPHRQFLGVKSAALVWIEGQNGQKMICVFNFSLLGVDIPWAEKGFHLLYK